MARELIKVLQRCLVEGGKIGDYVKCAAGFGYAAYLPQGVRETGSKIGRLRL